MKNILSFFCPCPRGIEDVLHEELTEIATLSDTLRIHQKARGGVHASGILSDCWLLNLHSRIATRILLRVAQSAYKTEEDIYRLAVTYPWENWFTPDKTIRIDTSAVRSPLKSLNFTTLRIKDGVVDRMRSRLKERPSVDTHAPDIRIVAFLDEHNATIYLDTSGEALFKRGWRSEKGEAPLRENLAAALLRLAKWTPDVPLFDPMCGSGTILVEAAQMACGIAPGANRSFSFEHYNGFDAARWAHMKSAVPVTKPDSVSISGSDISEAMLAIARNNIARAGIPFEIPLNQIEAQEVKAPAEKGLMLTNPPYGARIRIRGDRSLSDEERISSFYGSFGSALKQRFAGWQVFLFTADMSVPKLLRLKESRKTPLYNGAIECRLFRFDMVAGSNRRIRQSQDAPEQSS